MDTKALKSKILDLAIRGALVENHTAEGEEDGAALLRRITHYRTEKQKADCLADCQKRGYDSAKTAAALKKLPSLAPVPVPKAEQPFEIPDNWTWCRLGDIFEIVTGSTPSKRNSDYYSSSDYPFYKPTDLEQGLNVVNCQEMISEKAFLISRQLPKHSILVTCIGTIGKTGVIQEEGICNQQINALLPNQNVSYQCFYYFLLSNFAQAEIRSNASATTLPILNKNKFGNLPFPLPPLSVQQRIVAKIEEAFAVIAQIEEGNRMVKENTSALKARTLSLAMRGALVENHTAEGEEDGAALLRRITHYRTEKQKADCLADCQKRGYDSAKTAAALKKLPSLAPVPVTKAEQPFEIPDNWTWCRLGEVCELIMGASPAGNTINESDNGIEFHQGKIFFGEKYLSFSNQKTTAPIKIAKENSILLCVRAPVGKVNITQRKICIGRGLCAIIPECDMPLEYFYFLLQSLESEFNKKATGTTFVAVTADVVRAFPIPLPPLSVQQRIVAKIEEVFALANVLEKA